MSQATLLAPLNAPQSQTPEAFRIVLIEDDVHIARLIEANLAKARIHCWHSGDGRGGLRAIEKQKPHLVLLDLMLPDINGYEVCARIRQNSHVPIIMITARSGPEYQMQGLQYGADDYITKPFDPKLLMARVASQLRRSHRYNIAEQSDGAAALD